MVLGSSKNRSEYEERGQSYAFRRMAKYTVGSFPKRVGEERLILLSDGTPTWTGKGQLDVKVDQRNVTEDDDHFDRKKQATIVTVSRQKS